MISQSQKLISLCIPTYEMLGKGAKFLRHNFEILSRQTFKDFEVVISDHSRDGAILEVCKAYEAHIDIKYLKNEKNLGSSSANLNNAIRNASGKIIKILFQDDFLYSENSLKDIVENFDLEKDKWLVTACTHTTDGANFYKDIYPRYDDEKILFKNSISSPSVLAIKNEDPLLFDEKLIWYMDSDYYKRCYEKFGNPKIMNEINVVNRVGAHQISNTIVNDLLKQSEYKYILKKHKIPGYTRLVVIFNARMYWIGLKRVIKKFLKR